MKDPDYDKTKHSLNKLGYAGMVPVLPMMPCGAQVTPGLMGPRAHYLMDPTGVYVNGGLPGIPPSKAHAVMAALKACPKEPSYSGTGTGYFKLTIGTDPDHADRFLLLAGTTVIGYGLIDPGQEIVSGDEDGDGAVMSDAPAPAPGADPAAGMGTGSPASEAPPALTDPDPDPTPEPETETETEDPDPEIDLDD